MGERTAAFVGMAIGLALVACAGEGTLVLQVRSDLIPGTELASVETVITTREGVEVGRFEVGAAERRSWGVGARVAETSLAAGRYRATVSVRDASGAVTLERRVAWETRSGELAVVTILLTRDCLDVVCPGAADAPELTSCVAGRCAEDGCTEETPDACGPPACSTNADCAPAPSASCASRECTPSGACVDVLDHEVCASTEVCSLASGCGPAESSPLSAPGAGHAHVVALDGGYRTFRVELVAGAAPQDLSAALDPHAASVAPVQDTLAGLSTNGEWLSLAARRGGCTEGCVLLAPVRDLTRWEVLPEHRPALVGFTAVTNAGDAIVYIGEGDVLLRVDRGAGGWASTAARLDEGSGHLVASDPSLTLDQSRVLFLCGDDTTEPNRGAGVCEVPLAGGAVTERLAAGSQGADVFLAGPREQPDGTILFEWRDPSGTPAGLRKILSDGSVVPAAGSLADVTSACVLPDGRVVARVENVRLGVFDASGSELLALPVDFGPATFDWYVDGCGL
ncbi:MAG: hypothetical protein H6719_09940 [Sandaracinaceae bacterium]|nr:hypothetical protein [Sandaracinaceae bacterium]